MTSFPAVAGKWQVSRGGGTEPRWRGDGKEIFYIAAPGGMLMSVPVNSGTVFATDTRSSVPGSRPRPDLKHGCLYLRRHQRWQAFPREPLRETRTRRTVNYHAEFCRAYSLTVGRLEAWM